ncbi:AI-2E family transporter [Larkinella insperata]|uniref:AI-2E family transporter n=1 Tax=Larkinella insperata TaxID=332158 RepID=A0ABW3QJI3_9BACT|nr:AI-2E family transporter [Larkinella insperata]
MKDQSTPINNESFAERISIFVGITILFLALVAIFIVSFEIILLIIAALLIALPLRAGAKKLHDKFGMKESISLVLVILGVLAVLTGMVWLLADRISTQIVQFQEQTPDAIESARRQLTHSSFGRQLLNSIPSTEEIRQNSSKLLSHASGLVSGTFGTLSNLYVVLFMAAFIVVNPTMYRSGIITLVPKPGRKRTGEILDNLNQILVSWLLGQLFSMFVVGVLTFIGLWILGVQLAGVLALFAGLISFIPNLGPIIALVPALLFASLDGFDQVLYVLILYLAVQTIESSVATPIVQKRMINMPPALVFGSQLVIGAFGGLLGLTLATPIMAMLMVLVKMIYVQDMLEDDSVQVQS